MFTCQHPWHLCESKPGGKKITPQPKISQELCLHLRSRALSQHMRRSLTGKPTSSAQRDCVTKHGQISRCGSAPLLRFTHRHTHALSLSPSSHKQEVYMREVHVISMDLNCACVLTFTTYCVPMYSFCSQSKNISGKGGHVGRSSQIQRRG